MAAVLLWVSYDDQPTPTFQKKKRSNGESRSLISGHTAGKRLQPLGCRLQPRPVCPESHQMKSVRLQSCVDIWQKITAVYYKEVITFNKLAYFLKSGTLRFWWKEFSIEKLVSYQKFLNILHFPITDSYHPYATFILVYHDLSQEPWEQARYNQPGQRSTGQLCSPPSWTGPSNQNERKGHNLCHTA